MIHPERRAQALAQRDSGTFTIFPFWKTAPFSQWAAVSFEYGGVGYRTAEHWMMAQKATLFNDQTTLQAILRSTDPAKAKALGRQVRGFSDPVWCAHRFTLVVMGNLLKFTQNPEARAALLATGKDILVEASPYDPIWGIGMDPKNPDCKTPASWKGLNLLGFALCDVRTTLKT